MILRFWFWVFLGQKSRVNNLATVGSITWPPFWPKFCPERWPSYWPYFFHSFFVKACFFFSKISFSLQKEEYFWKTKKQQKTIKKRWPSYWLMVAKLLTLQHIYILYIYRERYGWVNVCFLSIWGALKCKYWANCPQFAPETIIDDVSFTCADHKPLTINNRSQTLWSP